jgi:hypothetical protein
MFKNKKYVIISARVHPGEVPASHMMNGILNYLINDNSINNNKNDNNDNNNKNEDNDEKNKNNEYENDNNKEMKI